MGEGSKPTSIEDALTVREAELEAWLAEHSPECIRDQRHLDAGSPERTYWHYGYLMAVKDVLALLGKASTQRH